MILNVQGNNENILLDNTGNIDLSDFSYLVDKYICHEAYIYFTESVNNLFDYIESLESELESLMSDKESENG